jgi:cytochrome c oxidase subunit 1
MIFAGICGGLLLIAFLSFFINIVISVGLQGVIGIFRPSKMDPKILLPAK